VSKNGKAILGVVNNPREELMHTKIQNIVTAIGSKYKQFLVVRNTGLLETNFFMILLFSY